jgi:hypothetical protein
VKIAQTVAETGCTILSCDLEKAFDCIRRNNIHNAVKHMNCELLTSWFSFFFSTPPTVHFSADPTSPFDMNNVQSWTLHEGVALGDPLASFLFCITFSFILRAHKEAHPRAVRATVMDDTLFAIQPSSSNTALSLCAALVIILAEHNLTVNCPKSVLYCAKPFDFTASLLPFSLSHDGFHVCRVPVGSEPFCLQTLAPHLQKVAQAETAFNRLYKAMSVCMTPGRGFIFLDLIRLCFRSRFSWCMRTFKPQLACHLALAADSAARRLLSLVLPHHRPSSLPPEWMHLQQLHEIKLSLSVAQGGLGLRSWTSLLHTCHFSSLD